MTTTCTWCQLNDDAYEARKEHGVSSAEYREALARLIPWRERAAAGRQHSPGCVPQPLVRVMDKLR